MKASGGTLRVGAWGVLWLWDVLWLWGAGVASDAEQLLEDFGGAMWLQKNKPHCSALLGADGLCVTVVLFFKLLFFSVVT